MFHYTSNVVENNQRHDDSRGLPRRLYTLTPYNGSHTILSDHIPYYNPHEQTEDTRAAPVGKPHTRRRASEAATRVEGSEAATARIEDSEGRGQRGQRGQMDLRDNGDIGRNLGHLVDFCWIFEHLAPDCLYLCRQDRNQATGGVLLPRTSLHALRGGSE